MDRTNLMLGRPTFTDIEAGDFSAIHTEFNSVELKEDGWWGQLALFSNRWELYSRSDRLVKSGDLPFSIEETVLHGEYLYGTEWAKSNSRYNMLIVHSATKILGVDVSNVPNFEVRLQIALLLKNYDLSSVVGGISLNKQYPVEEAPRLWKEDVMLGGYEGLVFKDNTKGFYAPMARMKREVTVDYVCMGFEDSDSDSYAGIGVACIVGGAYNKEGKLTKVCRVSGLTREQRVDFFKIPGIFVGKVFTAKGKKITKKGALRHPNFVCWREDKDPSDVRVLQ